MHYTLTTQWLCFGKNSIWLFPVTSSQYDKVHVLCDAQDIVNMAILYWSLQLCGYDSVPTIYGMLFINCYKALAIEYLLMFISLYLHYFLTSCRNCYLSMKIAAKKAWNCNSNKSMTMYNRVPSETYYNTLICLQHETKFTQWKLLGSFFRKLSHCIHFCC